jgi:hypothetical protein
MPYPCALASIQLKFLTDPEALAHRRVPRIHSPDLRRPDMTCPMRLTQTSTSASHLPGLVALQLSHWTQQWLAGSLDSSYQRKRIGGISPRTLRVISTRFRRRMGPAGCSIHEDIYAQAPSANCVPNSDQHFSNDEITVNTIPSGCISPPPSGSRLFPGANVLQETECQYQHPGEIVACQPLFEDDDPI